MRGQSIFTAVELRGAHDHQFLQLLGNRAGIHDRAEVRHHGAHNFRPVGHAAEHVGHVVALAQQAVLDGLRFGVNLAAV